MSAMTGAGPFYVIDNIELEWAEHRNNPCDFVHSSAYGQWGNIMMELVQQDSEGPSPFRDLYAPGEEGIHHVACFVSSVEDTLKEYKQRGYPTAAKAKAKVGTEFAFIDTSEILGHMMEIYVYDDALAGFYSLVKEASVGWDGDEILRSL
jgi:glyoxalase/bleomycin resistance protein/dioxygenase superfamily protein